uniref:oligopeptidase A n=2 Tax=Eutreptiella gymnastica TaxID=73025 RepID=A0A7S1HUK8_9EUGL|mmetsp:Transcript_10682/g.19012  ORF Transcript_10682/g.19012 Transcript_10682/m.19012 type:complete len:945 (+) Transcript_10682:170-3004(+)
MGGFCDLVASPAQAQRHHTLFGPQTPARHLPFTSLCTIPCPRRQLGMLLPNLFWPPTVYFLSVRNRRMYRAVHESERLPLGEEQGPTHSKWAMTLAAIGVGVLVVTVSVNRSATSSLWTATSISSAAQSTQSFLSTPQRPGYVSMPVKLVSSGAAQHLTKSSGAANRMDTSHIVVPTGTSQMSLASVLMMTAVATIAAGWAWIRKGHGHSEPLAMVAISGERLHADVQSSIITGSQRLNKLTVLYASTAMDAPANPLLDQSGLPRFGSIGAENVKPAVTKVLANLRADFKVLEEHISTVPVEKMYKELIEGMEKLSAPLEYSWGVVGHLLGVKNSPELREVHEAMQGDVITTSQALGQSLPVYNALQALKADAAAWDNLEGPQQRIVEASLRSMKHSGVGLEGEQLKKFNQIALDLATLSTKFSNNVLDSTKAFTLTLTEKEQIAGLPASALALYAQTAKMKGHENATPENGPWVIGLDIPAYMPAMQHLKDGSVREQLYRAYVSRASTGDQDNAPIISQILKLKKQRAQMLGYNTAADMSIASKMAGSVEDVDNLSEMLRIASFDAAKRELADVQAFAEKNGFQGKLALWDVPYWSERQKEALYTITAEELKPYFALPMVLQGLFDLCERIFNVKIVAADGQAEVWHEDVRFFKIEENGEHIASFYLDPYSRPENKRGGAWMGVCQGSSKVMNRKPVAYLTCNGSPPAGDVPSLMPFQEVTTLFHEMGHGLQHMLTRVQDAEAAGISGVEWDAVELPSQFMENWCYDRATLFGFAKHYSTGEPLPEEMFQKLVAQKNYNSGMAMLRQINFQQIDMQLHSRYDPDDPSAGTSFDVMQSMADKYAVIPPLPEDRFLCTFGHIFAGGYSAGYYSYKWAEVMSADAFAAFEEVGLENEEAVREVGKRFRETVLALGGGKHPSDVYREFRGRDPTPDALIRHNGLATN